jgi:hypothetical protein
VNIDVSETLAIEFVPLDIAERFIELGDHCRRKLLEQFQDQCAIGQATAGNLTQYKRMHDHIAVFEQIGKQNIALAKMVDPHRCVDEDQLLVLWRRRRTTLSSRWLPPSLARRLALSRSINALRLSCNKVERSRGPVSLIALANKLSSRFTVVRIGVSIWTAPIMASSDAKVDSTARVHPNPPQKRRGLIQLKGGE